VYEPHKIKKNSSIATTFRSSLFQEQLVLRGRLGAVKRVHVHISTAPQIVSMPLQTEENSALSLTAFKKPGGDKIMLIIPDPSYLRL